ncbi:phosphotransferase [Nakamurella sp. YIM 132087]|uniref:Phosphotransferase n=1 Tax=Nakamurella alba TaxID=2665158 RepID=A0A7K1FHY6_9ACTN|nr:aminoglycoside phosphotransferase family protein [Nakamurella alba]MTD13690.1 phosphotransferase [Nakamurella alba]
MSAPPGGGGDRIRIEGDRVLRPARWWTPTVHTLLDHLRSVGFTRVPRPLGIVDGTEILELIPGDSGNGARARIVPDAGLRALAVLLRDFHQAAAGFVPPAGARWAVPAETPVAAGQLATICHGDFGAWNVVWHGLQPVGLLDFDFARPGAALSDVAYALEFAVPFRPDVDVRHYGFDTVPDRRRRIEIFAEAYGLDSTAGLVDAVIARQWASVRQVQALAAAGVEPQRTWVADGVAASAEQVRWTEEHRALLES